MDSQEQSTVKMLVLNRTNKKKVKKKKKASVASWLPAQNNQVPLITSNSMIKTPENHCVCFKHSQKALFKKYF